MCERDPRLSVPRPLTEASRRHYKYLSAGGRDPRPAAPPLHRWTAGTPGRPTWADRADRSPSPPATRTPGEATRTGPQREPIWVMGVPVGPLGGQKDAQGLSRTEVCLLPPAAGQRSRQGTVPPACFSGTPRCSGHSSDSPPFTEGETEAQTGTQLTQEWTRTVSPPPSTLPPAQGPMPGRRSGRGTRRRETSGRARPPLRAQGWSFPSCAHWRGLTSQLIPTRRSAF